MNEEITQEEREKATQAILRRRELHHQNYLKHRDEVLERARQNYQDNRERKLEYQRQYNQEHNEEINEQHRQYYQDNREKIIEYVHQYGQNNKGKVQEFHKRYREEHKEEIREYLHQYHQDNKEKLLEWSRRYRQEHPEVHRQSNRRRRALKVDSDGHFTNEEFRLLCETFENKCIYCGQELPLVADHMTPLSRGGSDGIDNIVPACANCNNKKHTMTFDEYVKRIEEEVETWLA